MCNHHSSPDIGLLNIRASVTTMKVPISDFLTFGQVKLSQQSLYRLRTSVTTIAVPISDFFEINLRSSTVFLPLSTIFELFLQFFSCVCRYLINLFSINIEWDFLYLNFLEIIKSSFQNLFVGYMWYFFIWGFFIITIIFIGITLGVKTFRRCDPIVIFLSIFW